MALTTYPLNNVKFSAADAELFHCTRTSGVFDGDDFACSASGADNSVTVGIGIGWIRNSKFSGKVVALKESMTLDFGVADSVNPRIDAVVIRFDANANKTTVEAKKGTAAASPVPPEVLRTEAVYELHLYHVRREPGAAAIPVGALTDLRMDNKYCGLMEDDVSPKAGAISENQLPVVPMSKGGTEAKNGADGLKNLLAAGYMVASTYQIVASVEAIPADAPEGAVFLVPMED
jgi:hypothetical protein